jgi:uncharacterized protein YcbK (DUF882 family)
MNISEHFTLEELTRSFEGARKGLDNTPPANVMPNLKLCAEMMENVRSLLNKPIQIHSSYRSPAINKLVGGKPTSQHLQALAVDFVCPAFGSPIEVANIIVASNMKFGKLIYEYDSWIHLHPGTERKVFTINSHGTFTGIRQ